MKSRTTTEFRKLFAALPKQVQEQARAAYRQFKEDPSYPSLRFKVSIQGVLTLVGSREGALFPCRAARQASVK